jgi:hypothetical protein
VRELCSVLDDREPAVAVQLRLGPHAAHCRGLRKPLVIFEALRVGYPWANDRLHRSVLEGMAAKTRYCKSRGIRYLAYVEPTEGAGKGLLRELAEDACLMVTDEFPCFFLPKMVASAAKQLKPCWRKSIPTDCCRCERRTRWRSVLSSFGAICKRNSRSI